MKARLAEILVVTAFCFTLPSVRSIARAETESSPTLVVQADGALPSPPTDPSLTLRRLAYLGRFYLHFAGERQRPIAEALPADFSWHQVGYRQDLVPFAGVYSGRDEVAGLFEDYFEALEILDYRFQYKLYQGDYVTWHFRLVARVPATGKVFDAEFVHLWRFGEDDRPMWCRSYYDTQVQIEAFAPGGPAFVKDLQMPDDYEVRSTPHDTEGLVRTVYDKFYAGDIASVFPMLADDAAVWFKGTGYPFAGVYIGKAEILTFVYNLAGTAQPYDISRFQVTEGDRTDVVLFENWTVFSTGKPYHVHTVNSWRVNADGLLMGFTNVPDTDEVAQAYVAE